MAKKSEDITLQMDNVRYKKGDGILYLMAERLGWMPKSQNNFTISLKYSDIKMQKISAEGKSKIQLQIILHGGSSGPVFQFANLEDRTLVKDTLLQILPEFKGKMPKDRARKALILKSNPHLLQLYKDFVESGLIVADDFWSQFVDDHIDNSELQSEQQDVGVSGDFLSGVPQNAKQIKATVSFETLTAILKTYPKVAEKYREMVHDQKSEVEFWNKFFQSRYFNRDRTKDLFSDCLKSEEKEFTSAVEQNRVDLFYDFDRYDTATEFTREDPEPSTSSRNKTAEHVIAKKFNQHSMRILGSLEAKTAQEKAIFKVKPDEDDPAKQGTSSEAQQPVGSHIDLTFHDLAGEERDGDYLDDLNKVGSKIHQVDRQRYTIVPQSQNQPKMSSNVIDEYVNAMESWDPKPTECLTARDATEALKHLSPGGYLMRSSNSNRLSDTVNPEIQTKLENAYFASNELLKHFWRCLPAMETNDEAKLVKIYETMKKFESSKLQTFYDSLPSDQRQLLNHLIRAQFKTASRKYDNWKSKKRQRELTAKPR